MVFKGPFKPPFRGLKKILKKALKRMGFLKGKENSPGRIRTADYGQKNPPRTRLNRHHRIILSFLREHWPEEFTPKVIAHRTGLPHGTVKRALRELLEMNMILQPYRGFYAAKSEAPVAHLPPLQVHGVKLEVDLDSRYIDLNRGGASLFINPWILKGPRRASGGRRLYTATFTYLNKTYTIKVLVSGRRLELFLNSSHAPLDLPGWLAFTSWLRAAFPGVPYERWRLVNVGFNRDYFGIDLKGLRDVSITAFDGFVLRIYEKAQGWVRQEVHVAGNWTLDDVVRVLRAELPEILKIPKEGGDMGYA